MNAFERDDGAAAFELRVLQGPQRGACVPLAAGAVVSIGGRPGSDIVLRDIAASDQRFELTLLPQGLRLKAGDAAPEERAWLQPIRLGPACVAVGPAGHAGWAALLADAPAADGPPAPRHAERPAAPVAARRPWARRLVVGGAAVTAASLSMLALAVVITPREPGAEQRVQRAQALLHAAGFNGVTVAAEGEGVLVAGHLDTRAQRTRAEQLLAGAGLRARLDVAVDENVALAVRDVYRVQGVQADVQRSGPGTVLVRTALADPAPLAEIEKAVRRDVQGLSRLETHNEPPPRNPSPVPTLDDPGKRVAAIVASDEPYVVTADGTRYFVGALLPTGHRILGIEGSSVRMEREGALSAITF